MKYKVGDKVRVRGDLKFGKMYGKITCIKDMKFNSLHTIEDLTLQGNYKMDDGFIYSQEMFEPINDNDYEIHITTKGTTTHAVMKKDGEVVKRSMARLNPTDDFDFEFGADLCMNRLFEEEFKPYLKSNNYNYGIIGTPSNLTALFGESLFVGDMVEYYDIDNGHIFKAFIIDSDGIGVMRIHDISMNMKNGIVDRWQVRKVKSYEDLVHGECDNHNVKAILKED